MDDIFTDGKSGPLQGGPFFYALYHMKTDYFGVYLLNENQACKVFNNLVTGLENCVYILP